MKENQKTRYEVILAGSGGQGLVLSGIMLGEAAILEGKVVVQTQSYGIASRGGFSMAEVIIDQEEIVYQQVQEPDIVLTLTEEALEKYLPFAEKQVTYLLRHDSGEGQTGNKPDRLSLYPNRQRPGKCGFRQHPCPGCDDRQDPDGEEGKPGPGHTETIQRKGPGDESAGAARQARTSSGKEKQTWEPS